MGARTQTLYLSSLVLLVLCVSQNTWARNDLVPGSRYTSARGAGMADAAIPLGDDAMSGLFYNPANLARIRNFGFEPFNIQLQANNDYVGMVDGEAVKVVDLASYSKVLGGSPEKFPGILLNAAPSLTGPHFAVGLLYQKSVMGQYKLGNIRYRTRNEFIPAAGYGLNLASGVLRIGYSLQMVNKAEGDRTVASTTTPMGWNEGLRQGGALSHNFGFALTLPFQYLPAFNLVARNVMDTKYTRSAIPSMANNASALKPATEKMSIDASLSMISKVGAGAYFNVVAEYRDAMNAYHTVLLQRLTFGAEFSFRDRVMIRGGFGGGYPAFGIGLKSSKGELSFGMYSEELGNSFRDYQDQRYIFQYRISAF